MNQIIRQHLEQMTERKYSDFQSALHPGVEHILGIRLPQLREYARTLARESGTAVLDDTEDYYFEETMLRGMVIGYVSVSLQERFERMREFIPLIHSWGVCDSFVSTLKFTRKQQPLVWEFLQPYCSSEKEFEQRFAAVMLLSKFVNEEYIEKTLVALERIGTQSYYASMGVAWALAECVIRFPDRTLPYLIEQRFDADTHNRAIQKCCDSYRVPDDRKALLKTLRIKKI